MARPRKSTRARPLSPAGARSDKLLDPGFREKAFRAALIRLPVNILAKWLKITELTWQQWRDQAEADPESVEGKFFIEYDSHACELPVQMLSRIAQEKDWRASAWLLACWWPQQFGRSAGETNVQINLHAEMTQARLELQAAVCPVFMEDSDKALLDAARARAEEMHARKRKALVAAGEKDPDGTT